MNRHNPLKIILMFCLVFILQQNMIAQEFVIKHYTNEDGLPDQLVYSAVQDKDGLMWFATETGVVKYDGIDWKYEGSNKSFRKLKTDASGTLWTTENHIKQGFYYYENGEWKFHSKSVLPDSLQAIVGRQQLNSFDFDKKDDELLIVKCSDNAVLLFEDGEWNLIAFDETNSRIRYNSVSFINHSVYISSSAGLLIYHDGKLVPQSELPEEVSKEPILIVENYTDPESGESQVWVLGYKMLGYIEDGKFHYHSRFPQLPMYGMGTINRNFLTVLNDYIFFGNQNEIFTAKRNKGSVKSMGVLEGLLTQGATAAFEDYEKNIWLPGYRGINKLKRRFASVYNADNGLYQDEVTAIAQFKDSTLIIGHNSGLTFYKDDKFIPYEFKLPYEQTQIFSRVFDILIKDENTALLAASHIGLGEITRQGRIKWLKSDEERFYLDLFDDGKDLWIGTNNGLLKKVGNRLEVDKPTAEREIYIRQIQKYDDGRLFLISLNGLFLYDGKIIEKIGDQSSHFAYCAFKLDDHKYLIGTNYGVKLLENKKISKYKFGDAYLDEPVYFISRDKNNHFWFGSSKGIFIWNGEELINYTTHDGLPHNETNRAAGFVDYSGDIWIGTASGMSRFEEVPEQLLNRPKPRISITGANDFEDEKIPVNNRIELSSSENNFTVHYRGYSFIDEKKLIYEVSILNQETGVENKFLQSGSSYSFINQKSGDYIFSVRVKNVSEVWSDSKTISIFIDQPFYYSYWFIAICVLIFAAIVFLVLNVFTQKKYSALLENEVEERTYSLLLSNKRHQIISESIDEVIWSLDSELNLDYVSPTVSTVLGYSPEAILRLDKKYQLAAKFAERYDGLTIDRIRREKIILETTQKSKDGATKYFEIVTNPIRNNQIFDGVIGVTRDITERNAREKSRAAAIIKTIENERTRIARDLHDHIGQLLASIKLRLELYQLKNDSDQNIDEAHNQLTHVRGELRNTIQNLHPMPLGKIDFISTVETLCQSFAKRNGLVIEFNSEFSTLKITDESKLMIFRIIQEALSNIYKHSRAGSAKICFKHFDNRALLEIKDDGTGFNFEEAIKSEGFGLKNIYQRANIIGAVVNIDTGLNKGTRISISFSETN